MGLEMDREGYRSVEEYIKGSPRETQVILHKIRKVIRKAAPGATEAISYQMPTFKLNGRNLVHFAAWKDHIGFYPQPSGTRAFQKELSPYKGGKGSIRFPLDQPIPYDLVEKIVRFRVEEETLRSERKRTKGA